jgi:hypothetical protein
VSFSDFNRFDPPPLRTPTVGDIFGVSRDTPLNYVKRTTVDGELELALGRRKHIVIFGSSKQGKTCLRKWNLLERQYITITCSNKRSLGSLHSAILKAAGYTVEQVSTKTVSGENKISAKMSAKFKSPIVDLSSEVTTEQKSGTYEYQSTELQLELDPSDVDDIIKALDTINFGRYIVLEDFHYLDEDIQRDFSVALKSFHEASNYTFIIVGVWLDENRLIQYNGDLTGRLSTINADAWTEEELHQVIEKGEELLGFSFALDFKSALISECYDSVWVVQEACYQACEIAGVILEQENTRQIGDRNLAIELIDRAVDAQSGRFNGFISNFIHGFVPTESELHKWILSAALISDVGQLENGLTYESIRDFLEANNSHTVSSRQIFQALESTRNLQVQKLGIKPIILDYDQSKRQLNVVDRSFLIWLNHQSIDHLLQQAELPRAFIRKWLEEVNPDLNKHHL